jgi:hypothetical protein
VRPPELLAVDEPPVDEPPVDEPPVDEPLVEEPDEVADPPDPVPVVLVEVPPPVREEHAAVATRGRRVMIIRADRMRGSFR